MQQHLFYWVDDFQTNAFMKIKRYRKGIHVRVFLSDDFNTIKSFKCISIEQIFLLKEIRQYPMNICEK